MNTVSIVEIQERLKELPPDKLLVVRDFVSYMADQCPGSPLDRNRYSLDKIEGPVQPPTKR